MPDGRPVWPDLAPTADTATYSVATSYYGFSASRQPPGISLGRYRQGDVVTTVFTTSSVLSDTPPNCES